MGANPHRHERCGMRIHLPHRYTLVLCGGRGTAADQVACTGMVVSTEGHNRDGTPSDDPITHPSHAHSQPAEAHTHGVPCETEHLSTPCSPKGVYRTPNSHRNGHSTKAYRLPATTEDGTTGRPELCEVDKGDTTYAQRVPNSRRHAVESSRRQISIGHTCQPARVTQPSHAGMSRCSHGWPFW